MEYSDDSDLESEYESEITLLNKDNKQNNNSNLLEQIKEENLPSIEIYIGRLKRRNELIKEMRAAYLRDIVLMKQLISELLTNDEREDIYKKWEKNLPSLDLHHFMLQHPPENSFEFIPCNTCGGTLEIVHHDSTEIKKLTLQLESMDQKKSDFRLIIATKTAQLDTLEEKLKVTERKYREEKNVLFQEIRDLKSSNESMRTINEKLENSKNVLSIQITELKELCSQTMIYQEQYRQISIEMERVLSEIRAIEELRKNDKEQIKTLTEKNLFLNERKDYFEKLSLDLTTELNKSKESQSQQQQIAETAQKLSVKLQATIDNQLLLIENLRADKSDLAIELETLKEESVIHIQEVDRQNEKLFEEKEGLERSLFELRQQLQTTKSDKELLESEFNELYMTYSAYRQECEPKISHIEKLYNDSQFKITELVCENESLQKKDKESQKIIKESKNKIEQLEIQTKTLQDIVKELEKKILDFEERLKQEEKEKNDAKRDYSSLKDRSRDKDKDKDKEKIYRQPRPLPTRQTNNNDTNNTPSTISLSNNTLKPLELKSINSTSFSNNDNNNNNIENGSNNISTSSPEPLSRLKLSRMNNQSPKSQNTSIEKSNSLERLSPIQKLEKLKLKTSSKVILNDDNDDNDNVNEISNSNNDSKINTELSTELDSNNNTTTTTTTTNISINQSVSFESENHQINNSSKVIDLPKKMELKKPVLKTLKLNSGNNIDQENENISPSNKKLSKRFEFFDKPSLSGNLKTKSKSGEVANLDDNEKLNKNESIDMNNNDNENNIENDENEIQIQNQNGDKNSNVNEEGNDDVDDDDDKDEDDTFQDDVTDMQQQIMGKLGPKGVGAKRHTILSSMSTDEFSEETVNTTNMMNEAIAEILHDGGMNKKSVQIICRTITPVLTAFAQIISKSTIAVLRSIHMLQQCFNVFCKVNICHSTIKSKLSSNDESIRNQIIEAQNLIRNYDAIDQQKTSWISQTSNQTSYQIDFELLNLFNDSKDLMSNQRTISMSAYASLMKKYFGYQLDMRPVKLDKVLDSIFHMKAYSDQILDDIDKTTYHIDTNWFDIKLSSLDGLLLIPEAKRTKELKERNQNLSETLSNIKNKLSTLENEHKHLQNIHQTLENNYSVVFEQNTERGVQVEQLTKKLDIETKENMIASAALAKAIEAERSRINDLETKECQTDPNTIDNFTQTEFVVPPISLRHRLAISDRPLTVSSNLNMSPTKKHSNHVFYPTVTPGGNTTLDIESSLSHSLNEIKSQIIPSNSNVMNSYTQSDDEISILSNDSSMGSMSTYDTTSTWNSEFYLSSQSKRPSSQLQLNRTLPNVLSKTPNKKKRYQTKPEEFPSIAHFLSTSHSLPASPIKRNIVKK